MTSSTDPKVILSASTGGSEDPLTPAIGQETETANTSTVGQILTSEQGNLALETAPLVSEYINSTAFELSFEGAEEAFEYHKNHSKRISSGISTRRSNRIKKALQPKFKSSYAESIAPEFWKRWNKAIRSGEDVYTVLSALSADAYIDREQVKTVYPDHHAVIFGRKPSVCEKGSALDKICDIVTVECNTGVDDNYVTSIL